MLKNEEIIEAFRLCIEALRLLHPNMNPDEPCIAFEAFEAAHHCIDELRSPNKVDPPDAKEQCQFCDRAFEYAYNYCPYCGRNMRR